MTKRSRVKKSKPKAPHTSPAPDAPDEGAKDSAWRRWWVALLVILLVAAALRFVALGRVGPPGLNQDEAANAWNAYCLLETGKDQTGTRWPIFYSRCLGANRSTLYLYALMPFQAVGGMNVWTTRAPSALGGVLCVLLTYYVAARLFGRKVGLVAAGLLAVNPWHVQQSRWGHEAALCTLLVMAPLAAMLWANLPYGDPDDQRRRVRILPAAVAGALAGICCYGYPAVRVFLPLFLTAAVLVTWRGWWDRLKTRNGGLAIGLFVVAVGASFGPLAWQHLTDTESTGISRRSKTTWVWDAKDSPGEKVAKALARYPGHFGPDFLFINGDHYPVQSVPGFGQFHWYMLPLMILGLIVVARRVWGSPAARVLLVWLLIYPVSDCLSRHISPQHVSMHALRASPGMCSLILLAAVGAATAGLWLWRRRRGALLAAAGVAAVVVIALNVRFFHTFFGAYNDRGRIYHLGYHVDLVKACEWLRPNFEKADAIFCTTRGMNLPYVVTLVALNYDPAKWFSEPRDIRTPHDWDMGVRYGKVYMMYGGSLGGPWRAAMRELRKNGRPDRVILIARPDEGRLRELVYRVDTPDGKPALLVYAGSL